MTGKKWEKIIKAEMTKSQLYQEYFDSSIKALAEILEQRDRVKAEYMESGGKAAVTHKLDRGAENMKINPLLRVWMDLNGQALAYWNSMGLTAKSYKSMTGTIIAKSEGLSLEEMLSDLGI